jgi:hypothetical protein
VTYDERTVVHRDEVVEGDPVDPLRDRGTSVTSRTVEARPSGGAVAGRIVVFLFGLIQVVILLRIVLLLLDAREGNELVSFILNTSQLFVAPFEGILRTDALHFQGSIFDVAAVLAIVGWSLLEVLILALVGVFRREPA